MKLRPACAALGAACALARLPVDATRPSTSHARHVPAGGQRRCWAPRKRPARRKRPDAAVPQPDQGRTEGARPQAEALMLDVPWIQRDHVHIELVYKVTYAPPPSDAGPQPDDVPSVQHRDRRCQRVHEVRREHRRAGAATGEQRPAQYIPLIPVTPQTIALGQTIRGTVREDDFAEAELDLYAIGRGWRPSPPCLINNSQVNPIGLEHGPAECRHPRAGRDRRELQRQPAA